MYNLKEFSEKPDNLLHEINESKDKERPERENVDIPPGDFFNSAGNTRIDEEEETTETTEETKEETTDTPGATPGKKKVTLGKVISAKATITIINIFIPAFIVFAFAKFGYKVEKKAWKLNPEEREIMSPVIQDCLDYIEIDFSNPFYALAFVSIFIYGGKAFDAIPELKKMKQSVDDIDVEEPEDEDTEAKEYATIRMNIEATTSRKDRIKLIIDALIDKDPQNFEEAFKTYSAIFPNRNEKYFSEWLQKNFEALPVALRFDANDGLTL